MKPTILFLFLVCFCAKADLILPYTVIKMSLETNAIGVVSKEGKKCGTYTYAGHGQEIFTNENGYWISMTNLNKIEEPKSYFFYIPTNIFNIPTNYITVVSVCVSNDPLPAICQHTKGWTGDITNIAISKDFTGTISIGTNYYRINAETNVNYSFKP